MSKVGGEQFGFARAWIEWNASQRPKIVGIVKIENLMEKEDLKKIAKMSLKLNSTKRKYMDSLFVKCLKK